VLTQLSTAPWRRSTSWRWAVSFTPHPLYSRGKIPRYPLDRRLCGPQSRSGRRGEGKILEPTGIRTMTPRSSSPQPVAIPATLSQVLFLEWRESNMPGDVTELSARNVESFFNNFMLSSNEASSTFAENVYDENRPNVWSQLPHLSCVMSITEVCI
jgi:hypothetical protein